MKISNPQRRNERERRRVQHLNSTLHNLKDKIPDEWKSQNMSKIDILRKASAYIRLLRSILSVNSDDDFRTTDDKYVTKNNNQHKGRNSIQEKPEMNSNTFQEYTGSSQRLEMNTISGLEHYQKMDSVETAIFTQDFNCLEDKEAFFSDIYSFIFECVKNDD